MTVSKVDKIRYDVFRLLDMLGEETSFDVFWNQPSGETWGKVENALDDVFDTVCVCSGCTKGVIIDDDLDYVVKIPFLWHDVWSYQSKRSVPTKWIDYCKVEYYNYLAAIDAKLESCFAETIYLGTYEGVPIYAQERVECDEDTVQSESFNAGLRVFRDEVYPDMDIDNEELLDRFSEAYYDDENCYINDYMLDVWGVDTGDKYTTFCEERMINDVHAANIGFRHGEPVVIDFSGFGANIESAYAQLTHRAPREEDLVNG